MSKPHKKSLGDVMDDILAEKYCQPNVLHVAQQLLSAVDQSEEDFLGAQAVLLLNGLI